MFDWLIYNNNRQMSLGSSSQRQQQSDSFNPRKIRKQDDLSVQYEIFNQQFKALNKMQLMQNQTGEVYVDQQKKYVVIPTLYLKQLKANSKQASTRVQQVMLKIKQEQDNAIIFGKSTQIKNYQIQQLTQKYNAATKNIEILQNSLNQCQAKLKEKDLEIQVILNKLANINERAKKNVQTDNKRIFNKANKYVQTQFDEEVVWIGNLDEEVQAGIKNKTKTKKIDEKIPSLNQQGFLTQIQVLKKRFQQTLEKISNETQRKLSELSAQKIGIQVYHEQNKKLKAQNEQLRKKIIEIDEKQIKLQTWKKLLSSSVQQIEKNYREQRQQLSKSVLKITEGQSGPLSITAEQKIKTLQATIDRLQIQERQRNRKALQIKKLLDEVETGAVSQENIVGTLLGLSAKIKEIVKFLLEEI